ncbi:MAG: GNAT family N-acetyltransferase [Gemmatimonadota bacterium]
MSAPETVRLDLSHRSAVVDVLAEAFCGYPVMRFVLGEGADHPTDPGLRALIDYYVGHRLVRGWPVLGVPGAESLRAAITISEPDAPPHAEAEAELGRLRAALDAPAFERMQRFERASAHAEPPTRHLFVGMVGVRPGWQGRGLGRTLLERSFSMASAGGYQGVCLSTELPDNVRFYERLGFRIVAETDVDQLHTWCLFRPS